MTERLKLRNESDVQLLTYSRKSSCTVSSDWIRPLSKFGVRLECKVVVNFKNYYVDSLVGQTLQVPPQRIERGITAIVEEMYSAPWFGFLSDTCFDGRGPNE